MNPKTVLRIAIIFSILTCIGLLLTIQANILSQVEKEKPTWNELLVSNFGWIYLWGLTSPLVLKLGNVFPLGRNRLFRNILIHFFAAIFLTIFLMLLLNVIWWMAFMIVKGKPFSMVFEMLWDRVGDFVTGLLVYCIILGIGQIFAFYKKYRERVFRASQLQARLAEVELETLKMQLHPTYLFNTLRSIARLIYQDVEAADRMIARLGDFLRLTLEAGSSREITLQQELDYLKCYLEIERIRLGNRLSIELVTLPETLDWPVPALILQPIVESVFQFSTIASASPQFLELETWLSSGGRDAHRKNLEVRLKGKSYTKAEWNDDHALTNARRRLQQIYGTMYRLDLRRDQSGNLEVRLRIPLPDEALEKPA